MIVIDASVMVDALVGEASDSTTLDVVGEQELHAPALLDFEVASALRGHALAGRLGQQQIDVALEDFVSLRVERYAMTELLPRLLQLRENFTAYDAAYVVLALALDAPLVTADAALRQARRLGVEVRVLG